MTINSGEGGIFPFSQSPIWQLQTDYFEKAGIKAWQNEEVPHYITSNPVVGKAYAELVLALLKDLSIKGRQTETVYILELGAGHGRLCYHFFKHFEKYAENTSLQLPPVCYVLSDFTEASLEFWKTHPRLQPYLQKGWLDFSLFDAASDSTIKLECSGKLIKPKSLEQPLVVVANYFFDSIPQELFRIRNGTVEQVLVAIEPPSDPEKTESAPLIDSLKLIYSYAKTNDPIYPTEPILNNLLQVYQKKLSNSHLLFPHIGIRCLENLQLLSKAGLVLLSADKGEHHLSNLDHRDRPRFASHGSFSLIVNYHALQLYCGYKKGLSLFPRHQHAHIDLGCLLMLDEASSYSETINAYDRFVQDFGPDDFFSLKKMIEKGLGLLSYHEIIAMIRLSGYDARIFRQMLPDLYVQLPLLSDNERWSLLLIIPRIWDTYFPLGEADDLALSIGNLLLGIQRYEDAIIYYEKSIVVYGRAEHVLYNIALCHCLLKNEKEAIPLVSELLALNPDSTLLNELVETFGINITAEKRPG